MFDDLRARRPKTVAIVEAAAAVDPALRAYPGDGTVLATTSPFVLEACATRKIPTVALDGDLSQEDADAVGYAASDATLALREALDPVFAAKGLPPLVWALIHGQQRATTFYLYKALLLSRLLAVAKEDGFRVVTVGTPDDTPVQGFRVLPDRFDTLFSVLGARVGLDLIPFEAPRPTGAMETGDYLKPSFWSRCITVMNAPVTSVVYRAFARLFRGRPIPAVAGRGENTIVLNQSNELVEELFLATLFRRRIVFDDFRQRGRPKGTPSVPADLGAGIEQQIRDAIEAAWKGRGLEPDAVVTAAAEIVAARTALALAFGLDRTARIEAKLDATLARHGRAITIVNANSSPEERLLRHVCERRGVAYVNVEHGIAPGLSPLHRALYRMDDGRGLSRFLFYTFAQRDLVAERLTDEETAGCAVAGVPTQVRRIGLRPIQRAAQRTALGLSGRVVCWCTGFYPNNYNFLPHYWRDTPYHAIRREIVYDVFGAIRDDVLFKLYPTYRYTDPDPFSTADDLPRNIRIEQFTDFRNMRAAVDVVIVDGAGSILSWAFSAGVPVIYLETGMYVVTEEFRQALEDSAFVVDTREDGWKDYLSSLLQRPHRELVAEYAAKAVARRAMAERYVFGPSDRRGARFREFIGRYDSAAPITMPEPSGEKKARA